MIVAFEQYTLTLEDGTETDVRLELVTSGAFSYGNSTCMAFYEDGKLRESFDTRYEKGCNTPEQFHDWSFKWLKGYCRPTVKVERAE